MAKRMTDQEYFSSAEFKKRAQEQTRNQETDIWTGDSARKLNAAYKKSQKRKHPEKGK